MFLLFVFTKRPFISIFIAFLTLNVNILASNESENNEINEVLNSSQFADNLEFNQMEINDNRIESSHELENNTIDSNVISIAPEINDSLQSSNKSEDNITALNATLLDTVLKLNSTQESKVNCTPVNSYSAENQSLEINSTVILVNSSKLSEYLESKPNISQSVGAVCTVVMFFYKWCPFSARYAKHYNALGRVYPQFNVLAIDAYGMNSVNMRYGLVGVPTILFFHNGKIAGKVNDTNPTIDGFVAYIQQLTGLSPVTITNLTDADLLGPLSSTPELRFDYLLLMAWIFAIICFGYLFGKSNLFKTTIETVRNNWREAEAQHEHID